MSDPAPRLTAQQKIRARYATQRPAPPAGLGNGLPAAVSGNAGDTAYGMGALEKECAIVAAAPEGTRDQTINDAAYRMGRLIGGGELTEATARANLAAAARLTGQPEHEIRRALRSDSTGGIERGKQNPRYPPPRLVVEGHPCPPPSSAGSAGVTATNGSTGATHPGDSASYASAVETPSVDVEAFWTARPELDHIRTYARARRACPWAVLGVVLARVVVATPRWVVLPALVGADASLNLYVALVATSGGGKGASEACAADAVRTGPIDAAGVGSGEGIAHLFLRRVKDNVEQHREAVLMRVAEIDTLAALGDRKGATLLPELRKAWSGEDLGFAYADPTKALPLPAHTYRLCLVAGVQPGRAQWVLDDADGGTPQRFMWMPAVDPDAPDVPPACPLPLDWKAPRWPTADAFTGRSSLPVCETARLTIDQARLARLRGEGGALDGHALLARLKAAAALSILSGRAEVADEDWELSAHIAAVSEFTRQGIVNHLQQEAAVKNAQRADAEASRAIKITERQEAEELKKTCQFVMRKVTDAPDGLPRSQFAQSLTKSRRDYLDAALDGLVQTGQLVVEEGQIRRWKLP